MPNAGPHAPDVVAAGYPENFNDKQLAEVLPHIVRVEDWPEVSGERRQLSPSTWKQLEKLGYASIPRMYWALVQPKVRVHYNPSGY